MAPPTACAERWWRAERLLEGPRGLPDPRRRGGGAAQRGIVGAGGRGRKAAAAPEVAPWRAEAPAEVEREGLTAGTGALSGRGETEAQRPRAQPGPRRGGFRIRVSVQNHGSVPLSLGAVRTGSFSFGWVLVFFFKFLF